MKEKLKKLTLIGIVLAIIVTVILIINSVIKINSMYNEFKTDIFANQKDLDEYVLEYEEASTSIGQTVEETQQIAEVGEVEDVIANNETIEEQENKEEVTANTQVTEEVKEVVIPDPIFGLPVEGEILKPFSKDNLVYSDTLKEWTTHNGIDIGADLTTVVKASAEGTVKSIKNDPRYGLTIIVEHVNGYETRYSNLLTAEFVVEGEKVGKGQTLGTVGNTASFEVADKPHLHFELLKNSEYLNPEDYINS